MKTTVTEFQTKPCTRCGGAGFLAHFQHRKGGECFRCATTGQDPDLVVSERPMTNDEILAALGAAGFPVVFNARPETGDFLADLFMTPQEAREHAAIMASARAVLAALPTT